MELFRINHSDELRDDALMRGSDQKDTLPGTVYPIWSAVSSVGLPDQYDRIVHAT